jgi:prune family protein 2
MSSDSEPDVSQYQTEVHPTFQTVALVSNPPRLQQSTSSPKLLNMSSRRKISLSDNLKSDENSSNDDSLSNESIDFPDDLDDNDDIIDEFNLDLPPNRRHEKTLQLVSLSPSCSDNKPADSVANGNFAFSSAFVNQKILNHNSVECIPEYSAADEAKNVRNFQLITLPDGKTREIDMKVC